ncbi:MAG: translation initiation factor IF-1 [Acidobacteria bacterium]|nr:translation initiation factor IF-1 [Acidobacteriota bacterium]
MAEPMEAVVVELLPQALIRLELTGSKRQILAHAAGAKEVNFVRLRPGDPVMVAVSEQDRTRGRIVSLRPGR